MPVSPAAKRHSDTGTSAEGTNIDNNSRMQSIIPPRELSQGPSAGCDRSCECLRRPSTKTVIGNKPAGTSNQPIGEGCGECFQGYSTERSQGGVTKVTHPAPVTWPKTQRRIPTNRLNFSPQLIHQADSYLPTALLLSKRKAKHTQA
ncbi:hypothetical protein SKAU_G00203050 [Synaphobranchus kaupii]|uniref:Uncharacterized protein n=1 Tax=Synaphobranchus kaupii TaxID=118154 RepID=A0A9Q1FFT3_SYNKA|nr:hypothetical protein SKAU_G00203050 [Synaphobranchus kaupii]